MNTELLTVELPLYDELRAAKHDVRRQVACSKGRVDIVDDTNGELIECKARGDISSIAAAREQLRHYRHDFFDPYLAIAVPRVEPEARWLLPALAAEDIRVIEIERSIGV